MGSGWGMCWGWKRHSLPHVSGLPKRKLASESRLVYQNHFWVTFGNRLAGSGFFLVVTPGNTGRGKPCGRMSSGPPGHFVSRRMWLHILPGRYMRWNCWKSTVILLRCAKRWTIAAIPLPWFMHSLICSFKRRTGSGGGQRDGKAVDKPPCWVYHWSITSERGTRQLNETKPIFCCDWARSRRSGDGGAGPEWPAQGFGGATRPAILLWLRRTQQNKNFVALVVEVWYNSIVKCEIDGAIALDSYSYRRSFRICNTALGKKD